MKLRKFSVVAVGAVLALSACGGTNSGSLNKSVQIAVELPFQGSDKAASDPILNGIRLAVKQAGGDPDAALAELNAAIAKYGAGP